MSVNVTVFVTVFVTATATAGAGGSAHGSAVVGAALQRWLRDLHPYHRHVRPPGQVQVVHQVLGAAGGGVLQVLTK